MTGAQWLFCSFRSSYGTLATSLSACCTMAVAFAGRLIGKDQNLYVIFSPAVYDLASPTCEAWGGELSPYVLGEPSQEVIDTLCDSIGCWVAARNVLGTCLSITG